jgi:hypothetical protein
MLFRTMNARGAYGRTANADDWKSGKDFFSIDHDTYFSIRDSQTLREDGIIEILFYRGVKKVFSVKLHS